MTPVNRLLFPERGDKNLMQKYGDELFAGTALFYSRYRPLYPASLIRFLIQRFALDGTGQMLDLGRGDGRLALRFVDWFEKIMGIDQEAEMIQQAIHLQQETRFSNTKWFLGDLENYNTNHKEKFKLVTIAKAFHWMEREKTLELLFSMVSPGGGIAIIDPASTKVTPSLWELKVDEVMKHWYGGERRAGNTIYRPPSETYEQLINRSNFDLETIELPPYQHSWNIGSIIGNIYSSSYGAKHFLGDNSHLFERHLREELLKIEPTGSFKENIQLSVQLALK